METAKVNSKDLRISTKQCVEICSFIRNKNLLKTQKVLEEVIKKKIAVPYKRYNRDTGHKPGIAAGRYPVKATTEILKLLKSVQSNAEDKGLDTNLLSITKSIANKGSDQWHAGRKRRRRMKRTHIQLEVSEIEKEKEVKKVKEVKTPKVETKEVKVKTPEVKVENKVPKVETKEDKKW